MYVSGTAPATTPAWVPESSSSAMIVERYAGSENQMNIRQV
jgi:hypothetical protein